jgi:hypothetical protein
MKKLDLKQILVITLMFCALPISPVKKDAKTDSTVRAGRFIVLEDIPDPEKVGIHTFELAQLSRTKPLINSDNDSLDLSRQLRNWNDFSQEFHYLHKETRIKIYEDFRANLAKIENRLIRKKERASKYLPILRLQLDKNSSNLKDYFYCAEKASEFSPQSGAIQLLMILSEVGMAFSGSSEASSGYLEQLSDKNINLKDYEKLKNLSEKFSTKKNSSNIKYHHDLLAIKTLISNFKHSKNNFEKMLAKEFELLAKNFWSKNNFNPAVFSAGNGDVTPPPPLQITSKSNYDQIISIIRSLSSSLYSQRKKDQTSE